MVSSINNEDLGILKNKNALLTFQKLFKIDNFNTYEEASGQDLKIRKRERKVVENAIIKRNLKEEKEESKKMIRGLRAELKKIKIEETEEIENEIKNIDEKISSYKLKDVQNNLQDKKEDIKTLKMKIANYPDFLNNINEIEKKLEKYYDQKDKLYKKIKQSNINVDIDDLDKKTKALNEKDGALEKIDGDIDKDINLGEGLLLLKQYNDLRHNILGKINNGEMVENSMIMDLLNDNALPYCLKYLKNEMLISKKDMVYENNINDINNLKKEISDIHEKIKFNKEQDEIKNKIKIIDNKINDIQEEKNKLNRMKQQKNSDEYQIKILELEQEKYDINIENMKYNEQYEEELKDLGVKRTELREQIKSIHDVEKEKIKIENEIELNMTKYKKIEEDINNNKSNKKKLNKLDREITLLESYKKLVCDKGIPSEILLNKIPFIQDKMNELLEKYTNYKIKIELKGNGSRKKLMIYQTKDKISDKSKYLSINSLSGYEMFILNILFKIVIKKYCHIIIPSFICIDEVWEKISSKNYDKLKNIFSILINNFKNILLISHIEQIKDLLDNYSGKHIEIVKKDKISYIK